MITQAPAQAGSDEESLIDLLRNPQALVPKEHILLLSHMRAYSSLLGHIFGSNPQICGYYEMHIGYYGWKSLVRQKLRFFREEQYKPGFTYMFDKVLHNDHAVSDNILNRGNVKVIFALRPPQQTIPSIVKLYLATEPEHPFASPDFAAQYYIDRLWELVRLAGQMHREFYYLDAACVQRETGPTLETLSQWLALETPLSPAYELQKKTSQRRYGDTSPALQRGEILQNASNYRTDDIDKQALENATNVYQEVRQTLIRLSAAHSVLTDATSSGSQAR